MAEHLYWFLHITGLVVGLLYVFCFSPAVGLPRLKSILCGSSVYISSYSLMLVLYAIVTGRFGGQNLIRVMIFIPPITLLFSEVFMIPKRQALDLFAPVVCISQAVAKPGCQFVGCCKSWLVVSWGIMNRVTETRLFPLQLAEGLTSMLIAVFLIVRLKRKKEYDGGLMAEMLLLFGLTRVGWEYLRDSRKYFFGLSELAFWALAITVVGTVWLIVLHNKKRLNRDSKIKSEGT